MERDGRSDETLGLYRSGFAHCDRYNKVEGEDIEGARSRDEAWRSEYLGVIVLVLVVGSSSGSAHMMQGCDKGRVTRLRQIVHFEMPV